MNKVAITSTGRELNSAMDPRFGRCSYFIIMDVVSGNYEAFENPAVNASGGAGIQAAQFISEKNVDAVISGNYGPNAFQTLNAAEIRIYTGFSGTVFDNIEAMKQNKLQLITGPSVQDHYGMNQGQTGGRGGGRGMGGGRGRGGN